MNIFVLDDDPIKAAQMLCDCHVRKMLLESCQLLSTHDRITNRHIDLSGLYKSTHENHPCRKCLYNEANRMWLVCYTNALVHEYHTRFGKWHKCTDMVRRYWPSPEVDSYMEYGSGLMYSGHVYAIQQRLTIPRVMPAEFIVGPDKLVWVVSSYRDYYKNYKKPKLINNKRGNMWRFTNREDWTNGLS